MKALNEYFGFTARQLRALLWLTIAGAVSLIYLIVHDFSRDDSGGDGLTIYIGGQDQTYRPVIQVDLNNTPRDSLELVPGIGPTLASRIVAYRDSAGNFESKQDVLKVRGIGQKTYQRIEKYIVVGK